MSALQDFTSRAREIIEELQSGEYTLDYASTLMDIAIEELRTSPDYVIDIPDDVMEIAFRAYADMHVEGYKKGQLLEAEACSIIDQRARDDFEDARGYQFVEALNIEYRAKITGERPDEPRFAWN